MRRPTQILAILLLLLLVFSGQSSFGQNRRKRDLTKYDNGGAFDLRLSITSDARTQMTSTVRDFVWEHWINNRLGHIARTVYSKEGEPTTYHLFIEPDARQTWHVVMTYRSKLCSRYGPRKPKLKCWIETGAARYETVERVPTLDSNVYTLRLRRTGDKNDAYAFVL